MGAKHASVLLSKLFKPSPNSNELHDAAFVDIISTGRWALAVAG